MNYFHCFLLCHITTHIDQVTLRLQLQYIPVVQPFDQQLPHAKAAFLQRTNELLLIIFICNSCDGSYPKRAKHIDLP